MKIDESKLRAQLQIHDGDNKEELELFWSRNLNIPIECFNKTIVRPKGNKVGKSNGTCKIRYNSKELYLELEEQLADVLNLCNNGAQRFGA